ncbi:MAG: anthranilate synthase component I [Fimbriimonadaceae bacterium]|nr:anthranilate synthase component I [Fimbriimonadaceae bacterium]
MQVPSKEEFLKQTGGSRPMPVYRDLLADMETPLSVYWKLANEDTYSFLLESVTGGEQLARYSILGTRPKSVIRTKGQDVVEIGKRGPVRSKLAEGQDPLDVLRDRLNHTHPIEVPGMPKFVSGAVGMLGYDIVRFFESLPDDNLDDLNVDDMAMMLVDSVVVFDHAKNLIRIIVMAEGTPDSYESACAEIERILSRLRRPLPDLPNAKATHGEMVSNRTKEDFEASVQKAIDYIGAGDGIQFVLSQRLQTPNTSHPLTVYRALRSLNPSPYMFLLRFGDYDIVGASPELLVSLQDGEARVRPIAGTRWRGATPEEDDALAAELLADEKERAEHVMLVDLGRNDLGRVSKYGTVVVREMMIVERYSHVMHIVSDVVGQLDDDKDAFDLLRASFPAGTVSGAPKVRAMQIIDELEPTRRGCYAGAVGYVSAYGDLDMAITIRTILLKGGQAYVQAGAGIVFDSVPSREYEETLNKAKASLRALEIAHQGLPAAL